jgi:signal transduction histidine kinase
MYFCCLEALQNVAKHAQATEVTIELSAREDALGFSVSDNGIGFDSGASYGSGLQNMSDRLEALGGSLRLSSEKGIGTKVAGTVPVKALETVG